MESSGIGERAAGPCASRVARTTHRFWEGMAVVGGCVLIAHGALSIACLDLTPVFLLLSGAEIAIGAINIGVDVWFLTHV